MGSLLKTTKNNLVHYHIVFWNSHVQYDSHPRHLEIMQPFILLHPLSRECAIQIPAVIDNERLCQQASERVRNLLTQHDAEEIGWLFTDQEGCLGIHWQDGTSVTYLPEWLLRTLLRQQAPVLSPEDFQSLLSQVAGSFLKLPPFPQRYLLESRPQLSDECPQDGICFYSADTVKVCVVPMDDHTKKSWWLFDRPGARWCMLHLDQKTPASRYWPLPDRPAHLSVLLLRKLDALFSL